MRLGKTLYLSNANNPSTRADLAVHRSTDDVRAPADASARLSCSRLEGSQVRPINLVSRRLGACGQGATWVSTLPMVAPGALTGYSSLTGLGTPGKIGIVWELVCWQSPGCGSGNTNTTIVWSELPADF